MTKARKAFRRAHEKGFNSCVDRYSLDVAFHEAKTDEGATRQDMAKLDFLAHIHLASAARTSRQVALGSASGKEFDHTLVKLAYTSVRTWMLLNLRSTIPVLTSHGHSCGSTLSLMSESM